MKWKHARLGAVILAADDGVALRPLTRFLPKPLFPVASRPLLRTTLEALAKIGCTRVAVCVDSLGERIERAIGDQFEDTKIDYVRAPASETGTLGALKRALRQSRSLASADALFVINGDTLCDWPLKKLLKTHLKREAGATLLLSKRADIREFGGGVILDKQKEILALGERAYPVPEEKIAQRLVFAGAQVLNPAILNNSRRGPEPGSDQSPESAEAEERDLFFHLYDAMLREPGAVGAVITKRRWHELGTPRRYLQAAYDWGRGRGPLRAFRRRYKAPGCKLEPGVRVKRSVVESGVQLGRKARVIGSVMMTGSQAGEGSVVRDSIVAPGVTLPPRTQVLRRLVTPLKAGRDPGASDSVVGDLVYTPIERRRFPRSGDLSGSREVMVDPGETQE